MANHERKTHAKSEWLSLPGRAPKVHVPRVPEEGGTEEGEADMIFWLVPFNMVIMSLNITILP